MVIGGETWFGDNDDIKEAEEEFVKKMIQIECRAQNKTKQIECQ